MAPGAWGSSLGLQPEDPELRGMGEGREAETETQRDTGRGDRESDRQTERDRDTWRGDKEKYRDRKRQRLRDTGGGGETKTERGCGTETQGGETERQRETGRGREERGEPRDPQEGLDGAWGGWCRKTLGGDRGGWQGKSGTVISGLLF